MWDVEMEFSLYGEEGCKLVEGVANFQYLGIPLDQMNDDWLVVWQKIMQKRSV